MKNALLLSTLVLLVLSCKSDPKKEPLTVNYPVTAKADSSQMYFGWKTIVVLKLKPGSKRRTK